jgi:hypothetical protein
MRCSALLGMLLATAASAAEPTFRFDVVAGRHVDVKHGDRLVVRFVNAPRDATNADTHYLTFKPFHHVYDPVDGTTCLTSDAHPKTKDVQFPHHRGLFFGFNKITYGEQTADIWHGTKNVYSTFTRMVGTVADATRASHTAEITWHGPSGDLFATEERTIVVHASPAGTTKLDWATTLSTKQPSVRLEGDPQHAGFHIRATQEVAKSTAKQTVYVRPDGVGRPGETRNWEPKTKDPRTINLPWNAMAVSLVNGQRYTFLRIPHPTNPKETRGSERDYGRFGDYFEYTLTPTQPLRLRYRVWVVRGDLTVERCKELAAEFASPEKGDR